MKKIVRLENNRIDKAFLKEYFKEIESLVKEMEGLNDFNSYRKKFEREFIEITGVKNALAVNSGTDALQLALLSLGIGRGDEVIIPDLTYISTALVVKYTGADLILADVRKDDLTIDEQEIEKNITSNTKAIIAVHMFGNPANMEKIRKIAQDKKIYLIEDACQALGSKYFGKFAGTFGDMAAFSFSYYKPLSSLAGNGGILAFKRENYADKISNYLNLWKAGRDLANIDRKFNKISLTDIATTRVKLKYIELIIKSREKIKKIYDSELSKIEEVRTFRDKNGIFSVRENYPILAKERNKLYKYLLDKQIESDLPYPPIHSLGIFCDASRKYGNFINTEEYKKNALHLPLFSLMKEEECCIVVDGIKKFYKK